EHPAKGLARDADDDRILFGPRLEAARDRRVERAFADQSAPRRAPDAWGGRAPVLEKDGAGQDEVSAVALLTGGEQGFARPKAPPDAGKRDELHRLARHQAERADLRQPCDVGLERHPARPPAAATTSL